MGHGAQGGRIAAPIFKQFAKVAFKDMPPVPFVAPAGIRWVRVDRASGRRVFGSFPTREDPKSSVIWEAFQPQTEPRRSYRRVSGAAYRGEYGDERDEQAASARDPRVQQLLRRRQLQQQQQRQRQRSSRPAEAAPARPSQPAPQPSAPAALPSEPTSQ
jgi:penicillin-binding protein 1A